MKIRFREGKVLMLSTITVLRLLLLDHLPHENTRAIAFGKRFALKAKRACWMRMFEKNRTSSSRIALHIQSNSPKHIFLNDARWTERFFLGTMSPKRTLVTSQKRKPHSAGNKHRKYRSDITVCSFDFFIAFVLWTSQGFYGDIGNFLSAQ